METLPVSFHQPLKFSLLHFTSCHTPVRQCREEMMDVEKGHFAIFKE